MSGITLSAAEKAIDRVVFAVRQLMEGRSNAIGTFTLAAGVTSTVVSAPNCGAGSVVLLSPQTANAAGALATTYIPTATVVASGFTVQHANAATVDRTFGYECRG